MVKIVCKVGDLLGSDVFEIGLGFGGLICGFLVEGVCKVLVIEKDVCCMFVFDEICVVYLDRFEVINGDVFEINLLEYLILFICIVVNLFYNVGMELLVWWLIFKDWFLFWESFILMF